jgi:hypothetical protein
VIVNDETGGIWKEDIVTYIKILLQKITELTKSKQSVSRNI